MTATTITAAQIKAAFKAAGIKVRVRMFPQQARICMLGDISHDMAASTAVCASLGMTNAVGVLGCGQNQLHEVFSYFPGVIRRTNVR